MIPAFGYLFGAAASLALLAIPLALTLLIYVYRRNGTTSEAIVSTIYLLRKLPQRLPARKKFIPPLQFWLELLLFALLTGAAAGLFAQNTGRNIALLLDTSLSMAAINKTGSTSFDSALNTALADLSSASSDTTFSLFTSRDALVPISKGNIGKSEARTALSKLRPGHLVDHTANHVSSLLSDPLYDDVWVYTDHTLKDAVPPPRLRFVSVDIYLDRKESTNVWISSIGSSRKDGSDYIEVTPLLVSDGPKKIVISATCTSSVDETSLAPLSKEITLNPLGAVVVELGPLDKTWAYCEALATITSPRTRDNLSLDDKAWIAKSESSNQIVLISQLLPDQLGLDKIPLSTIVPNSGPHDAGKPAIYHRDLPSMVPRAPTLVIFPPSGPLPWGGSVRLSEAKAIPVTRWLESHPILRYVNMSLLSLPSMRILDCPPTAVPFMYGPEGPIACAGQMGGQRYAIVGMELFPFDGIKTPSLSILTLNILRWLFDRSSLSDIGTTPSIQAPSGSLTALHVTPTERRLELDPDGFVRPEEPGVIKFTSNDGLITGFRVFNILSDEESNISQSREIVFPPSERLPGKIKNELTVSVYWWLALVSLILLGLDVARRIATRAKWGNR